MFSMSNFYGLQNFIQPFGRSINVFSRFIRHEVKADNEFIQHNSS